MYVLHLVEKDCVNFLGSFFIEEKNDSTALESAVPGVSKQILITDEH